jgi:DNA-binding NarL/FixJ family response regulator
MDDTVRFDRYGVIPHGKPKLLVVDDTYKFHKTATLALANIEFFDFVGAVFTGKEAVAQAGQKVVSHVVLDLYVLLNERLNPEFREDNTLKLLKSLPHSPKVIVLTHSNTDEYRQAVMDLGADGFIYASQFPAILYPILIEQGLTAQKS